MPVGSSETVEDTERAESVTAFGNDAGHMIFKIIGDGARGTEKF